MIVSNLFLEMLIVVLVLAISIVIVVVICYKKTLKNKDNGACSEPSNGDVRMDSMNIDNITLCNVDMSKAKFSF